MRKRIYMYGTLLAAALMLAAPHSATAASSSFSDSRSVKEPPLVASSFAGKLTLDGQGGSVLSYMLPESVFLGLQDPAFRDLCVFDADGTPVPFSVRLPQGQKDGKDYSAPVAYFPWAPKTEGQGGAVASTPSVADIEITAAGTIVRIKGQQGAGTTGAKETLPPRRVLLDMEPFLKQMKDPLPVGLEGFSLKDLRGHSLKVQTSSDSHFFSYVTMQTSADLSQWRSLGERQALARMRQGDDLLQRDTLTLPPSMDRYLLLHFEGDAVPLSGLEAQVRFDSTQPLMRERIIPGTKAADGRSITYDIGGSFPLSSITFDMPQPEMMAVQLERRSTTNAPWRSYTRGLIYRLEKEGVTIVNDPIPVQEYTRYWRLAARDAIPFAAAPGLRAAWKPRELVFLARGKGPWTVAYGRSTPVEISSLPFDTLAAPTPAKEIAVAPPIPTSAPAASALSLSQEGVLWGVLGLAVLFLGGMAFWLTRSMRAGSGAKGDSNGGNS